MNNQVIESQTAAKNFGNALWGATGTGFLGSSIDTTDYGENSAKGVNGYLSVEPLPTELVFTISSNDEAEGPGGELGNITGLSDISRILSELADLGRSLADIISEVSINLVSDVDSVESSLKFDYNIEEEVNIVAWLNKGDISLLEEEERWVQGVWSSQIETDDGIVGEAELVKFLEHHADGIVHGLAHAGVDGAVLHLAYTEATIENKAFLGQAGGSCFALVFFPELGSGLDGTMHGVKGKVGEEWLVLVGFDEVGGFATEAEGEGFTRGS